MKKDLPPGTNAGIEGQKTSVDGEWFLLGNLHSQIDMTPTHQGPAADSQRILAACNEKFPPGTGRKSIG